MSDPEDTASDFDEIDPSFGPDFDADFGDDGSDTLLSRGNYTQSAWQRLDERKDAEWRREQLSDWDDWDVWGDDAELH